MAEPCANLGLAASTGPEQATDQAAILASLQAHQAIVETFMQGSRAAYKKLLAAHNELVRVQGPLQDVLHARLCRIEDALGLPKPKQLDGPLLSTTATLLERVRDIERAVARNRPPRPSGRPSKARDATGRLSDPSTCSLLDQIKPALTRTGLTVRQLAAILGVGRRTVYKWMQQVAEPAKGRVLHDLETWLDQAQTADYMRINEWKNQARRAEFNSEGAGCDEM